MDYIIECEDIYCIAETKEDLEFWLEAREEMAYNLWEQRSIVNEL